MTITNNHNNNIYNILEQGQQELLNTCYQNSQNRDDSTDAKLNAKLDASILLSHVLAKPKVYLHTWPEQILSIGQSAMYFTLINRRSKGEPIAYITGQKEFFSLLLNVNNSVLIPRPETELLVENILEKFKDNSQDNINILDLGTGSGAIAIALAKTRPSWSITAVDNFESALEIAMQNAKLNNVNNINFIQSDWFNKLDLNNIKYNCIVSNPPYIAINDAHLNLGDLKFEPRSALISDNNGLSDIELIISKSADYLKPNFNSSVNSFLIFEHGYNQLDAIKLVFNNYNNINKKWANLHSIKDYSNLPRAVLLDLL